MLALDDAALARFAIAATAIAPICYGELAAALTGNEHGHDGVLSRVSRS